MKKVMFVLCLVVLAIGSSVFAAVNTIFDNNAGDGLWRTAGNWTNGIPTGDDPNIGGNNPYNPLDPYAWSLVGDLLSPLIIDSLTDADTWEFYFGHGSSNGMNLALNMTGGTLDIDYGIWLGATAFVGDIYLNMSGGVISTVNLVPAFAAGNHAVVNMTGGVINVANMVIPWSDQSTNSCEFYLDNGTVNLTGNFLIGPRGTLYVGDGGSLVLSGDRAAVLLTYISGNSIQISPNATPNTVLNVDYDGTNTTLSAVTFSAKQAKNPFPANDSYYAALDTTLTWTAGSGAISHKVYFGKYGTALSLVSTQASPSYGPLNLDWGQAYAWRIDEWDGAVLTTGQVWTFTATDHILVENFDGYANVNDLALVWSPTNANSLDPNNGLGVYLKPGTQSLKLTYDNSVPPYYTEVSRTWASDQGWTYKGLAAISLWFSFETEADYEGLYIQIGDGTNTAILTNAASFADINTSANGFQEITVPLSQFNGVNLTKIRSIAIGMGSKTSPTPGNANVVNIDEIRLYPKRCLEGAPVGDLDANCKVDISDFAVMAGSWLSDGLWPN